MAKKHYGTKTCQEVLVGACIESNQTVRKISKDRKGNVKGVWQPNLECANHDENAAKVFEVEPVFMRPNAWTVITGFRYEEK